MKKLLKILGYDDIKYHWQDLEQSLKNKVMLKVLSVIPVLIGCVAIAIIMDLIGKVFMGFVFILYCFTVNFFILDFLYGKFVVIVGEVVEYKKQMVGIKKVSTYGAAHYIIKDADDIYYRVPASHHSGIDTGMMLALYIKPNTLYKSSEDLYEVPSLLAHTIINHQNAYRKEPSKNE